MNKIGRPKPGVAVEPTRLISLKLQVAMLEDPRIVEIRKEGQLAELIRTLLIEYLKNNPTK